MKTNDVKKTFEECASQYDEMIVKIVPGYHEQHKVILSLLPFSKEAKINVLDLGIGTGVLSHLILQDFARSHVHGVDIAGKMIDICKKRFANYTDRVSFSCCDIESVDYNARYDAVLAGLAIHHLEDLAKRKLFHKVYGSLNNSGIFLIRDIVKSDSDKMNSLYHDLWCAFELSNGIDPAKNSST